MELQNMKKCAGRRSSCCDAKCPFRTRNSWPMVCRLSKVPSYHTIPQFFYCLHFSNHYIKGLFIQLYVQNYVKTKKSKQEVFHKSRLNYPRINISYLIISSSLRVHTCMSSSKVHSYNTTLKFLKYQKGEIGSFFGRRSNMS